jgi:multiple sugar transport system permease protein
VTAAHTATGRPGVTGQPPPEVTAAPRRSPGPDRISNTTFAVLLILPGLALFVAVVLYPMIAALTSGFFAQSLVEPGREFVGLDNFEAVLRGRFWPVLRNTVVFTAGATVAPFVLGLGLALALNNAVRSGLLRGALLLPWVIPSIVGSFLWMWIFNANYGILNALLTRIGVLDEAQAWLGQPGTAMLAVITTKTWATFPWMMVMLLAGLQTVPAELHEAAAIDGAGAIRRFWAVTLPHLRAIIGIVLLLETVWNFQHFDTIYVLTGGGPAGTTTTFALAVYDTAFKGYDLGRAGALGALWMVLLLVGVVGWVRLSERRAAQ